MHGLKREKASGKKERYELVKLHKKKHIEKDISIILWTHIYKVVVFEIKHTCIYNDKKNNAWLYS